jgi:hypothetical protein
MFDVSFVIFLMSGNPGCVHLNKNRSCCRSSREPGLKALDSRQKHAGMTGCWRHAGMAGNQSKSSAAATRRFSRARML